MQKRFLILVLAAIALAPACSSQEIASLEAQAKADGLAVARGAQATLVAFRTHEATAHQLVAAIASAAPATGPLHDLALDTAAAEAALEANPGLADLVELELQKIAPTGAGSR